jgi:prepilin-type N-terminal cleavage/methylation domain-containing protein
MLFFLKKIYKSNKGFTLVELMVVVVIIGVLVAIAVPVYNNITIRAEQATVEANLRIIDSSILRYYALSLSIKQGYEVTLLSLPAGQGSIEATPTALEVPDPEGPNVLAEVEDLVSAGYLASVPTGPGNVSYGIIGEAPNQRATATGVIGKDNISDATLNDLPWRQAYSYEVTNEREIGGEDDVDLSKAHSTLSNYLLTEADYEIGSGPHVLRNFINESEKNIKIPEGIKTISGGRDTAAFWKKGLESVVLPNSLINIHAHAFDGNNLKEIRIPENVTFIRTQAFNNNPITKITIMGEPGELTIEDRAFGTGYTESKIVTDSFEEAYKFGGPGTYLLINNEWVKDD